MSSSRPRRNTLSAARASVRRRATACTAAVWALPVASRSRSMARRGAPPQFGTGRLGPTEIRIQSPAGGGWGDPKRRSADLVLLDVRNGLVSEDAARAIYGVAPASDGRSVDVATTRKLRGGVKMRTRTQWSTNHRQCRAPASPYGRGRARSRRRPRRPERHLPLGCILSRHAVSAPGSCRPRAAASSLSGRGDRQPIFVLEVDGGRCCRPRFLDREI